MWFLISGMVVERDENRIVGFLNDELIMSCLSIILNGLVWVKFIYNVVKIG